MNHELQSHSAEQGSDFASEKQENGHNCLWEVIAGGLRYCHLRINHNTSKTVEATSFLYALIELLIEKGLLTVEELDERKKKVAERLVQKFKESGLGLVYQDPEQDKYSFDHEAYVDCANRIQICKAICCRLPFALSKQDIEEGIIRWDWNQPYMIAHDEDGYCVHLDRKTHQCTVREHRPLPCRGFDCRNGKRWKVWEDFENRMINSQLLESLESNQAGRKNGLPNH